MMPLLISFIMHLSLAALMFISLGGQGSGNSDGKEPGGPGQDEKGDIAPPPSKTIEIVLEEPIEGLNRPRPSPKPKTAKAPDCKDHHWYGGVGVQHSGGPSVYVQITDCPPGYPAYEAGVRVNDILLNPNDLRGEPGTPVTIMVERRGETMVFKTKRTKICTED